MYRGQPTHHQHTYQNCRFGSIESLSVSTQSDLLGAGVSWILLDLQPEIWRAAGQASTTTLFLPQLVSGGTLFRRSSENSRPALDNVDPLLLLVRERQPMPHRQQRQLMPQRQQRQPMPQRQQRQSMLQRQRRQPMPQRQRRQLMSQRQRQQPWLRSGQHWQPKPLLR